MPKENFLSIIIPAYNHERYVGAAVESVLNQSFKNLELIVINDGSTDRTGEVVQSYDDSRITYIYQENQDASNTINRGLHLAKGDFIAILNSDDVYSVNRLERLLDEQEKSKAICILTDVQPILENGEPILDPLFGWNIWHQKNCNFYAQCGDLYMAFLKGNLMVTTSNLFLSADAVRQVGDFCSLRYLHDYDYIFRVMLTFPNRVQYLDEKLLYYRIHGGNTINEAAITGREQDRSVIRKYMLERAPKELRPIINNKVGRLIELENELYEINSFLYESPQINLIKQAKILLIKIRQKVNKVFILRRTPKEICSIINAGVARLIELEHELYEVRAMLYGSPKLIFQKQPMALVLSIYQKIRNLLI